MSSVIGFSENLRIEMAVPRRDSGGTMTLTRLPSWRRASAQRRGLVDAAADLVDDPLGDLEQMLLVAELDVGELELALALDEGLVGAVDHDVADFGIGEQLLERAEAEQFVDQHLFERELLAPVEVDLELEQHLGNDRAEFLGQLVLVEHRRGFGIDPLEQARKHLLLDLVDRGLEAFGLAARRFAAGVLARGQAVHRRAGSAASPSAVGRERLERRELVAAGDFGFALEPSRRDGALHRLGNAEARPCRPPFRRVYRMRSCNFTRACCRIVVNKRETFQKKLMPAAGAPRMGRGPFRARLAGSPASVRNSRAMCAWSEKPWSAAWPARPPVPPAPRKPR